MDHLPELPRQLLLLAPSQLPGRDWLDRMNRFHAQQLAPHHLRLTGHLPAGRYQMRLLTRSGSFPMATLMLPLLEWPSQRRVLAGPFDFDHPEYRMAVPTFRVTVNGQNLGLVWAEVPSPEDLTAGRLRALWGIEVPATGEVTLDLEVTASDRKRLRWSDLAELDLVADDRYSLPLPASVCRAVQHPRLLATGADFVRLAAADDAVSRRLRQRLLAFGESTRDGTYDYRTLTLALLARTTDEPRWAAEAMARAMALVAKPDWGYHSVPEIMGWNCDRDAGNRMLEVAVVFDWLHEQLSAEQRHAIQAKLAYHADIAYRMTLLQKNYWYHRCNEAHGQGLWCGLAASAAVLLGHDPRAETWLAWAYGGFDDAARHLQADGIATWYVFNISWHLYQLAILESVLGQRLPDYPFFQNFPARVLQVINPKARDATLANHLLYLARRAQSPTIQADARRLLALTQPDGEDPAPQAINPWAVLFHDLALRPGTPQPIYPVVCAERGVIACRGPGGSRFTFACGPGSTPAHHAAHNFINRTWYGVASSGSFNWTLDWVDERGAAHASDFQPAILKSYRQDTRDANVLTLDERGHFLEGRWLGSTLPLKRVAFLEHCASDGQVTYACGNASDAYADDLGVQVLTREWLFFHGTGIVIMRDRLRCAAPHRLAWHLHGTQATWEALGPHHYYTTTKDRRLVVRALASTVAGLADEALVARIERPNFVPTYTTGLNTYKTLDWQPELRPSEIKIPPYWDLQFAPAAPANDWELITAMGVDCELGDLQVTRSPDGLRVTQLPGGGELLWPTGQLMRLPGTGATLVAAAAARATGTAPWCCFHSASHQAAPGPSVTHTPPADLHWQPPTPPQPMTLLATLPPAQRQP